MFKIILNGEPKSTSHIYKVACRPFPTVYMSGEGKRIKEDYMWQAKSQYKGKLLTVSLEIWVTLYFGTKRKSDWDNFHKLWADALSNVVYEDDKQIQVAHITKAYDKEKPRIEIEIREL